MRLDISFDDGHISDLRAAQLLKKYDLVGTFYIPSSRVAGTVQMSLKEVKILADMGMEIGGHTTSHPHDLKAVEDDKDLLFEIADNKQMLEKLITKKPITKFCYPRGRHDQRVRDAVKTCGFTEARTTLVLKTELPEDPFQTPTTIHMFKREEYLSEDWIDVAKRMFKIAQSKSDKGMFSVWGHTVELDKFEEWEKFEELLKFIKTNI